MDNLNDMTLAKFKLWSEQALKVFLAVRSKSVDGSFEELAARCFCAWEENVDTNQTAEFAEYRLTKEYKLKLQFNDQILPDPMNLISWKDEQTSIAEWPSLYITDIASYLNKDSDTDLLNRLLNEYKEGKAYRYFSCGWVKAIKFHNISADSPVCFLKTKVTPSQAVRNKAYEVWVAVRKDSDREPGGQIISAYCTCTAGMFGTCNHIAGVLFRVEYAVKTGLTKPSGTSQLCQWNVPIKASVEPLRCAEAIWKKNKYSSSLCMTQEREKIITKRRFTPLNQAQEKKFQDTTQQRLELYNILKKEVPNSCFVSLLEKKQRKAEKLKIPASLMEISSDINHQELDYEKAKEQFLKNIKLSDTEIVSLSTATEQQSLSDIWREQRKGRLTASNFHRILTRTRTLQSNKNTDPSSLINLVMGHTSPVQTKAMKHGLSLESHAKTAYHKAMRCCHKNFKNSNCGMFVYSPKPFVAASPDLLVCCTCCGEGLCEIKCPETIKEQVPTTENVPYIQSIDGKLLVKKSHQYYTQIQGQMGVLSRQYCDLFIYTLHGSLNVRVLFDESFFAHLLHQLCWFWNMFILPKLIKPLLSEEEASAPSSVQEVLCGVCAKVCLENPECFMEESVCCDKCSTWIHFPCSGISAEHKPSISVDWFCVACSAALSEA